MKCIVEGCNSGVNGFKLPGDEDARDLWLHILEREDLLLSNARHFVCAIHFEPTMFTISGRRLKHTAIPFLEGKATTPPVSDAWAALTQVVETEVNYRDIPGTSTATHNISELSNMNNKIDTERVIEEVRVRSFLWDPSEQLYKNKESRAKAWENIGKVIIGPAYEHQKHIYDKLIQQRWKHARDAYSKTKAMQRMAGSRSAAKKVRKYIYYDKMTFLDAVVECPTEESVIEEVDSVHFPASTSEVSENRMSSLQDEAERSGAAEKPWSKKRRRTHHFQQAPWFEQKLISLLENDTHDICKDDMAFFISLGPTLKNFTNSQKLLFRSKMLEAAMEIQNLPSDVQFTTSDTSMHLEEKYGFTEIIKNET